MVGRASLDRVCILSFRVEVEGSPIALGPLTYVCVSVVSSEGRI